MNNPKEEGKDYKMNKRQQYYFQEVLTICEQKGWKCLSTFYINQADKMQFICNKGHKIEKSYQHLKDSGCIKCANLCPEQAKEEFLELLNTNGYILLGEYVNSSTNVMLLCPNKHLYMVAPCHFKTSGSRCTKCSHNCPEQAREELIEQLNKDGYTLIDEYINSDTKIRIMCPAKHIYPIEPKTFKYGVRCAACRGYRKKDAERRLLEKLNKKGYKLIGEYINSKTTVNILCSEGHIWSVKPSSVHDDSVCSHCTGHHPEQAKQKFIDKLNKIEYKLIGEYITNQTKTPVLCQEGHIWNARPTHILYSNRKCPHCRKTGTIGERYVKEYLESNGIQFYQQCRIKELPDKQFDFYFQYNGRSYLVEYDGGQHFKFISYFHDSNDDFFERQEADRIKTQYAIQNGYYLIRMDHTQINNIPQHIFQASLYIYLHQNYINIYLSRNYQISLGLI